MNSDHFDHHFHRFVTKLGPLTLGDLAQKIPGTTINDTASKVKIDDISEIQEATAHSITFLHNPAYVKHLVDTAATACFISSRMLHLLPERIIPLVTDNPHWAYAATIDLLYSPRYTATPTTHQQNPAKIGESCQIHPTAVLGADAEIGDHTVIGPYSVIGPGVFIGAGTVIGEHVSITSTIMGRGCMIKAGARLGESGFGFARHSDFGIRKINHVGYVLLGEGVEIGANTCIDRGVLRRTTIGDHTKIDNLVQIGHNVSIGANCFICGQAGIAGSTRIGDEVNIGGQAGLAGHITIGDRASLLAQSGVMGDIAAGTSVAGSPAMPRSTYWRGIARVFGSNNGKK